MTTLSEILEAVADYDFAMRAASYGGGLIPSRDVLCNAIRNLPSEELLAVRMAIQNACDAAVMRTTNRLGSLGVTNDIKHPYMAIRAATEHPK